MNVILAMVIQQIPTLIAQIKAMHVKVNPTLPPLTDADAIAMLNSAVAASSAVDDAWLKLKGLQ
jgi:hypothetical protein